jgi:hypothetical protein
MCQRTRCLGMLSLLGLLAAVAGVADEASLFPLEVGTNRFYHIRRHQNVTINGPTGKQSIPLEVTGDVVERTTGVDTQLFSSPVTALEARATETNPMGQVRTTTTTSYLSPRADGLYLLGTRFTAAEGGAAGDLRKYDTPLLWVKLPIQMGAAWMVGKLKLDSLEALTSAQVAGTEDVTVPAGSFKGCTKIIYRYSQLAGQLTIPGAKATVESGQGTTTLWLAAGTGLVKESTELTGAYVIRPENQAGIEVKAEVSTTKTRELARIERAGK